MRRYSPFSERPTRLVLLVLTVLLGVWGGPARAGAADLPSSDAIGFSDRAGGGGRNIVQVVNHSDDSLKVRGSIQLNRIPAPAAGPVNQAVAYASCSDCRTLAVALQINVMSRTANLIAPQNVAEALNVGCTGCFTAASAIQCDFTVDDPIAAVPPEALDVARAMDRELTAISADQAITLPEAITRLNGVIAQYQALASSLTPQCGQATEMAALPAPSALRRPAGRNQA
jgi:putative peptide zinc metalloprotease protein